MKKATSDAQLRATAKYDAAHTKRYGLKLNLSTDADVILLLDTVESKQTLIKMLLREYIASRRPGVTDEIYRKYTQMLS